MDGPEREGIRAAGSFLGRRTTHVIHVVLGYPKHHLHFRTVFQDLTLACVALSIPRELAVFSTTTLPIPHSVSRKTLS